jgi:Helix-turn-helix domain
MSILNKLFKLEKNTMKQTTKAVKTTKVTKAMTAIKVATKTAIKAPVAKTATKTAIKAPVANLAKVTNQVSFLEKYLRGTDRTLSVAQASANYGIQNLSARMSEFRKCGLKVETLTNSTGKTAYRVSARDVNGSRAKLFSV